MVSVVSMLGLASGFDRLAAQLTHKNYRVREQVLHSVISICETYKDELLMVPGICGKIAPLLNDTLNSVRSLALAAMVSLYDALGPLMMVLV
jgi:hypothetical protein